MGVARDFVEDAGALLTAFFLIKVFSGWRRDPWWLPDHTDKGGRGAGPGATSTPVPQGATDVWSESTMRLFADEMETAGMNPRVVLLGIAAATFFNADTELGNNVGLLLVNRGDLQALNCPSAATFAQLDAPAQIPWIGRVLQYRLGLSQQPPPDNVGDLALLLHPSQPPLSDVIRAEANRRATAADSTMLYVAHDNLLRHVLATPGGAP